MAHGMWSLVRFDDKATQPKVSRALLGRVAAYGKPYKGRIAIMLSTIALISILNVLPPLLVRQVLDVVIPQRDFAQLNWLALAMIVVPLGGGLLNVLQRYVSSQVGEGVIFDLRRVLYDHLQRMSLRFFTTTHTGELMSRLNNDVVGSQRALTGTLIDILSNTFALVVTLVVMLSLEWRLTLLALVVLPLFIIPARRVAGVLRDLVRRQLGMNAEMNAMMNETLNVSGALLVKIFGRAKQEQDRFANRARDVRDSGIRQAVIGRWFFFSLSLASSVGTALVVWLGGYFVLTQPGFTIGTLVAFTVYLVQLYGPITALNNARVDFATSLVSFERVFEVLDLSVEITEKPDATVLRNAKGRVSFNDVSFSYTEEGHDDAVRTAALSHVERPGQAPAAVLSLADRKPTNGTSTPPEVDAPIATRYALSDVSFTVEPGQLAALVGPSGAGKTTVTYLLPRLYDVTSGQITIDGLDIKDVTLESLAHEIGMVTQESYLFHDTIRANLLYARPDASDAEMQEACRAANIHEFILALSNGYDTVVGERGYRLSGGEKQRIAIARVLLKDPHILVLDEATSALDSRSEALIQAALERLRVGRTSLVIAHRLSTILAADVILVMDAGRLVEKGTHAELLARGGLYATLYQTQFRALEREEAQMESILAASN